MVQPFTVGGLVLMDLARPRVPGDKGSGFLPKHTVNLLKCTSRGIGKTQQRILDALAAAPQFMGVTGVTVGELVSQIGCSDNQIRRALRSLKRRGLVISWREYLGNKGIGEYGPLLVKTERDSAHPTSLKVKAGDPWPDGSGWVTTRDTEFYRAGMPTHGLKIAAPHHVIMASTRLIDYLGHIGKDQFADNERAELRQWIGGCQLSNEDRALLDHIAPDAAADGRT
jgi:hypothetical protein